MHCNVVAQKTHAFRGTPSGAPFVVTFFAAKYRSGSSSSPRCSCSMKLASSSCILVGHAVPVSKHGVAFEKHVR